MSLGVPEMEGILCHWAASFFEGIPVVEFMYLVFTRMPGESYRRRLRSLLLYLCDDFRALINSLVVLILLEEKEEDEEEEEEQQQQHEQQEEEHHHHQQQEAEADRHH